MKVYGFILLVLFLHLNSSYAAQNNNRYYPTQISLNDGLSQSFATTMLKSKSGELWVGTTYGLNRLDGYGVKNYFYTEDDSSSLPSNVIRFIAENGLGSETVIATDLGLVRHDSAEDSFTQILCAGQSIKAMSYCAIESELFFISSDGVIYRYNPNEHEAEIAFDFPDDFVRPEFAQIVAGTQRGEFLLGSHMDGIWRVNTLNRQFQRVDWFTHNYAGRISSDENGTIWVAPFCKGLYNYTLDGELIMHIPVIDASEENIKIIGVMRDRDRLWIATDGAGLAYVDIDNQDDAPCPEVKFVDPNTLPSGTILSMANNRDGTIWFGTRGDGIYNLKPISIDSYSVSSHGHEHSLSGGYVNTIYHEIHGKDEILWLGTDGAGLSSFNTRTKQFKHYPTSESLKIVSIVEWSDTELLISAFGRGIFIFNKTSGALTPFVINNKQSNEALIRRGISITLVRSGEKFYILGSKNWLYDRREGRFTRIDSSQRGSIAQYPIATTPKYVDLMYSYGVNRLWFDNNVTQPIFTTSSSGDVMQAVAADESGDIYFCTGNGLFRWSAQSDRIEEIERCRGLKINSMAIDNKQQIWLGTVNSLLSYNIHSQELHSYNSRIGYAPIEFSARLVEAKVLSDQSIVMVSAGGFIHIPSTIIPSQREGVSISLVNAYANGERIDITHPKDKTSCIVMPYHNNSVQIHCRINSENLFYKRELRYSINDSEFITTQDPYIQLGKLPFGSYSLRVECSTPDGRWVALDERVEITVLNVWYRTKLFMVALLLVTIGLIMLWSYYYRQRKELEYQYQILKQQDKINSEKVTLLASINQEWRTPLMQIHTSLSDISQRISNQEDIYDSIIETLNYVTRMKSLLELNEGGIDTDDINSQEADHLSQLKEPSVPAVNDDKPQQEQPNEHLNHADRADTSTASRSLRDEQFLQRLNSIIECNISNRDLDVNTVATQMAMSRSSLYNKMRLIVGVGISDYIMNLRIQRARELLRSTDMQIVEISELVGFSNQRYFSSSFKLVTKMTPTQYRRESRNDDQVSKEHSRLNN